MVEGRARRGRRRGRPRRPRPRPPWPTAGRYPPVIPLPRQSRSGRNSGPAHSEANSVPVRPKPVATSSQISSTPCRRQASPTRARSPGRPPACPTAPCTSGSMTTAASSSAWASTRPTALSAQSGVGVARGPDAPGSAAGRRARCRTAVPEREGADRVAVVGVARGPGTGSRPGSPRLTQYWKAILSACSTADRPVGGEQDVGVVDRHHRGQRLGELDDRPGCRCRAGWRGPPGRAGRRGRRRARARGGRAW